MHFPSQSASRRSGGISWGSLSDDTVQSKRSCTAPDTATRISSTDGLRPLQCLFRAGPIRNRKGGTCSPKRTPHLEAQPSAQGSEERLLYLLNFTQGLYCAQPNWSERSRLAFDELSEAMIGEALRIAGDRYERYLAERLRFSLAEARKRPEPIGDVLEPSVVLANDQDVRPLRRDFIMAPEHHVASWSINPDVVVIGVPAQ